MPQIHFTLKGAKGIEDKDAISKNDLYAVIKYGGEKVKTDVAGDGIFGFKYSWDATFNFEATSDNDIEVKLYDKDTGFDDFIGEATVSLSQARSEGSVDLEVPVVNKDREEKGVITVKIVFEN